MSQSTAPAIPQTRQKTSAITTKKTQKDTDNSDGLNTDVRTKEQAIAFLTIKEYIVPGKPVDLQTLAHILLQFGHSAAKMSKPLMEGIRSVAFLIADAAAQNMADDITTMVKEQLQEHMETFNMNVETMRDAVEHVTEAAKKITGKMEEFNDGFQETAEQLAQATQELTEKTTEKTAEQENRPSTYAAAAAVQYQPHPIHEEIITRGQTADKQILIQKDKNTTENALDSLMEKDLVAKVNTALDLMGIEGLDKPRHTTFIGAKKLRNGNILYQMNTKESANWLRLADVQKAFMAHFDGTSNMRNKLHYVIAEFVPTTFDAGSSFAHAKVEEDNMMEQDAIAFSRYIKPAHLRSTNQRVAHVTLGFNDRETANTAIQIGMFIEGKHVSIRKTLTEPRRCLKCQKFGHYANDCKVEVDTCARCGGHHQTTQCVITDSNLFCCTNCTGTNAKGHSAADRNCPAFNAEREKIQERIPENKYKYFPTSLPSTWRLLNETEPQMQQQHQQQPWQPWQQIPRRNPQQENPQQQQKFIENWQEVRRRRGRPPVIQNQQRPDNGWPVRPTQRTLEEFMGNAQTQEQRNSTWGDRDPNEQGPGPEPGPRTQTTRREPTPLEYA